MSMFFEVLGFVSGGAAIGTAWMLLLRHERWKVVDGFYSGKPSRSAGNRNALIWPSR
jgi:hypothetical protein